MDMEKEEEPMSEEVRLLLVGDWDWPDALLVSNLDWDLDRFSFLVLMQSAQ